MTPTPYRLPDPAAESAFADRIGVAFRDPYLLRLALTHRSVLHDWLQRGDVDARLQSNERLEFLGDALLGAMVARRLYLEDENATEGILTRNRAALVRAETLVTWAREIGMPEALYLGTGERIGSGARDRMLAGAFEALVGAIYLDQGHDASAAFVERFLDRDSDAILATERLANPKGLLQEFVQERRIDQPVYETVHAEGPDHAREFTVQVLVDGEARGTGTGRSKREAQQAAAREALISMEADASFGMPGRSVIIRGDVDAET